jgi:hypothetical protein
MRVSEGSDMILMDSSLLQTRRRVSFKCSEMQRALLIEPPTEIWGHQLDAKETEADEDAAGLG